MTLPYWYFLCNIQAVRDYKSIAIKFGFKLEKYSLQATNTYIFIVCYKELDFKIKINSSKI